MIKSDSSVTAPESLVTPVLERSNTTDRSQHVVMQLEPVSEAHRAGATSEERKIMADTNRLDVATGDEFNLI